MAILRLGAQRANHLDAVADRHVHVEQDEIEWRRRREAQRFLAVRSRGHFEAGAAERHPHHVAHRRRIVRGENAHHAEAPVQAASIASTPSRRAASRMTARVAEPLDLALLRGPVANEGAQQLHRGSVDALDVADIERHRRASRGTDTARASAPLHPSRCSWWQARSSAARAPLVWQPRHLAATGAAARLRFAFLVLIGLFWTDFTDSFAVSALAAVALGDRDIANFTDSCSSSRPGCR